MVVEISEQAVCWHCGGVKVLRDRFEPPVCTTCGRGNPVMRAEDVEWIDQARSGGNPQRVDSSDTSAPQKVEAVIFCQPNYFTVKPVYFEIGFSFTYKPMNNSAKGLKYRIILVTLSDELNQLILANRALMRKAKWTQRGWPVSYEIAYAIIKIVIAHLEVEESEIIGLKTALKTLRLGGGAYYSKVTAEL